MSWSIGFDTTWNRWIGYSVPAYCDHPGCNKEIDRGLSHVCGGDPYGGDSGCGLYLCDTHMGFGPTGNGDEFCNMCECCAEGKESFEPKPEHPDWIKHLHSDKSWARWRKENPEKLAAIGAAL